ncbi:hypothetical protein LCGC14_1752080 [marine sediment metagenome]|uniref:Uncharacterized protein n=1 Tax=marine sediment metagenome TaxID=412755 RepID=A0A0F9H3H1_9ZZZZ
MKTCGKCEIEKSESKFSKRSSSVDGLQYYCKECNQTYFQTEAGKKAHSRSDTKRRKKFPEKAKAHHTVNDAIRGGYLQRPKICESCGRFADIEGHHPDYSKPLEVDWLCRPCHVKEHADLVLTPEI